MISLLQQLLVFAKIAYEERVYIDYKTYESRK